ncbi:MAG TPA: hypothetical protein VGP73_00840 [Thermoanaerobaculia bacterium]
MERKYGWILGAISMGALLTAPARGQVALGGKAGSLGLGLELTVGLSPQWNARIGANGFNYTDDRRKAGHLEYDATAKLRTGTALLDWHPGGHGFRLSGGLVYNDTHIDGTSLVPASGNYVIGGIPVPVSLVGTLSGRIDFDRVVPYAGLGWGNAVGRDRKVGFFLDAGAIFQGKGKVKLTPNIPAGSPLNDPTARAALDILLREEENSIQKDVADYTVYPVVAIGLTYRF